MVPDPARSGPRQVEGHRPGRDGRRRSGSRSSRSSSPTSRSSRLAVPVVGLLILGLNHRFPSPHAQGHRAVGPGPWLPRAVRRRRGRTSGVPRAEGAVQPVPAVRDRVRHGRPVGPGGSPTSACRPQELGVGRWYISPYGYNPITFAYAMSRSRRSAPARSPWRPPARPARSAAGAGSRRRLLRRRVRWRRRRELVGGADSTGPTDLANGHGRRQPSNAPRYDLHQLLRARPRSGAPSPR